MSLLGGSECSTSANPIAQLNKHSQEDRSLQYERFAGNGLPQQSMRSASGPMSQHDANLMNSFNQDQRNGAFNFEQMRHSLPVHSPSGSAPAMHLERSGSSQWAREFSPLSQQEGPQHEQQQQQQPSHMGGQRGYVPRFQSQFGGYGGFGGAGYMQRPAMSQQSTSASNQVIELDDQNWQVQFDEIEKMSSSKGKDKEAAQPDSLLEEIATSKKDFEEYHQEESKEDTDTDFQNKFEDVWNNIRNSVLDGADGPAWDRDFNEFTTSRPSFGEYQFEENNRYADASIEDTFARGVRLMDSGANLSEAVLCFEAVVQKDPNHVEAWQRLGSAQAQNEKEDPAIRATERCIELDPSNLQALMCLSVSYTNEGYENAAYATLERWLQTKYPEIVDTARSQEPALGNESRFRLHERVTELFIRAAQLSPDGANMDADVQVGLGVLFYGNEEFDKAIDCFTAALSVRPDDPLLWNRLGATMANSQRSEEAVDAYYRALDLRPSFVRARYNLGVSCINIGCYKEAAQHLLTALSMHQVDGDDMANQSTNLYETLRRVFLVMDRRDLLEKVSNGVDVNIFRGEFDF